MLDMGFINDVSRLAKATHPARQTALFSATMPPEIEAAGAGPAARPGPRRGCAAGTTAAEIAQKVVMARTKQKRQVLATMLADEAMSSVLIFSRTKHGADRITRDLERDGFNAGVIHGNKSQNARQKALNDFRDGAVRILVATDIAARGIDVPGHQPRRQLRPAGRGRKLRPPHRPHRPQRRRRHRHHAVRSVREFQAARRRAGHPPAPAGRCRPHPRARSAAVAARPHAPAANENDGARREGHRNGNPGQRHNAGGKPGGRVPMASASRSAASAASAASARPRARLSSATKGRRCRSVAPPLSCRTLPAQAGEMGRRNRRRLIAAAFRRSRERLTQVDLPPCAGRCPAGQSGA